eukprot:5980696-Pyramimonas_sp.AAC.1
MTTTVCGGAVHDKGVVVVDCDQSLRSLTGLGTVAVVGRGVERIPAVCLHELGDVVAPTSKTLKPGHKERDTTKERDGWPYIM